nr:hypothetical protein [Okeania sp. SIO2F4]
MLGFTVNACRRSAADSFGCRRHEQVEAGSQLQIVTLCDALCQF